jgi:hypothetical protein
MAAKRPPSSSRPLTERLQLDADTTLLTVGLPRGVAPLLEGVTTSTKVPASVDAALLFAKDAAELEAVLAKVEARLTADPLLWFCYPKGTSGVTTDLNRERLWELLAPHDLRPVAQIAVDEVWSALRFRRGA